MALAFNVRQRRRLAPSAASQASPEHRRADMLTACFTAVEAVGTEGEVSRENRLSCSDCVQNQHD